ncbi:hypothetical protein BDW22DRAFT_1429451 [Trametopsis cervina]|nr:hypothetical protein BDW22DRAFT_1429451 [Trametopsis cervina]
MHSFTFALTALLAATGSFAAPVNSTFHILSKRDAVCGSDFRALVSKESCLPHGAAFQLTPPSTIARNTLTATTVAAVPANLQCDHTLELQLLNSVFIQSGVCRILTAMTAADSGQSKATLLGPAATHISALANLNFLDSTVNNKKKSVVQKSISSSAQATTDLDKAVGNYLALVNTATRAVAQTLDQDVTTIRNEATALHASLPDDPARRSKAAAAKAELAAAIAAFDATRSVVAAWDKLIVDAPHS